MNKKFEFKSVLFLGIGGVSMHQLALALKNLGLQVFGYDIKASEYTKICEQNGIKVSHKFLKSFCDVDLCVKNGAIPENNKYIQVLKSKKCPIIDRAELLGLLCAKFKNVIAVAGTHGKSTTSTLIYEMLRASGKKVSCHIGADVFAPRFDINDDYLVVEACEYKKSFLHLFPTISVITNIEKDHMDCYKNLFSLRSAFLTFLKRGKSRFVFLDNSTKFLQKTKDVNFISNLDLEVSPKLKGKYNLKNIALASAVALSVGVCRQDIDNVIKTFSGVPRRFELIGNNGEMKVFIDYAHHPSEIKAFTSEFCEEFKNNVVVFQPHTYSRTKYLFNEFVEVLKDVDNLIIYKEYPARENSSMGLTAKELYFKLKEYNSKIKYAENYSRLAKNIKQVTAVAFVGAGDINQVAKKFVKTS